MKTLSLIIAFCFLVSNCSHVSTERNPADIVQTQDEVLQVLEFRSSNLQSNEDYRKVINKYIEDNVLFSGSYSMGKNEVSVEFVEDTTLPKGIAYFPEFFVKDNNYKIMVLHSPEAVKDKLASAELMSFLQTLKNTKYFASHFAAFEMYYNALEQDPIAAQNWAKVREAAAKEQINPSFAGAEEAMKVRAVEWKKEKLDYNEMALKAVKEQKKKDLERRSVIDALDAATEDAQFKNLVAKNDRKGVASLLQKYLPWGQMAPFEKRYWENYLDSITHPLPMEKRIFIYRGVQDDFIYSAYRNGKELDREIARKEGDVFVMSSILTKNQGTWNRRLRSLTSMYEKFIATNANQDEFAKSARIVTMFVNHSANPQGSPFLSFTPKFSVANSFGYSKMSAYALDPRLVSFNFASSFKHEVEFLLPLMTFPEDIVGYYDGTIHTDLTNTEETMQNMFKQKLIKEYGTQKAEEIYATVMQNSKEYFDSALNRYEGKVTAAVAKEPGFFAKFFNKLFPKKPVTAPVVVAPKNAGTCIDIITHFWK